MIRFIQKLLPVWFEDWYGPWTVDTRNSQRRNRKAIRRWRILWWWRPHYVWIDTELYGPGHVLLNEQDPTQDEPVLNVQPGAEFVLIDPGEHYADHCFLDLHLHDRAIQPDKRPDECTWTS